MVSLNGRKKEHFRVQAGCGADERRNILESSQDVHVGTRPQQLFFLKFAQIARATSSVILAVWRM